MNGLWTRRNWLSTSLAASSLPLGGWLGTLAKTHADEGTAKPKRSCILLWMNGGPSQTDTFDLKPGHANGGPFQPIVTSAPGLAIGEHLPKIAQWMHQLSVVRSMSTKEGDHGRARNHLRTGYLPQGPIQFPVIGSLVSHEHGPQQGDLPHYVSVLSNGLFQAGMPPAGFLGPDDAPLLVGGGGPGPLQVENIAPARGVSADQSYQRRDLLLRMEREFLEQRPGLAADSHRTAYERGTRLMSPAAAATFDLSQEKPAVHERYGRTQFGQGCLLARRLVEQAVPFVEVSLGGWDTHYENFTAVRDLCGTLDTAWSALMQDLHERGLLESTLVVWMGEFGRTPVINPQLGRDHYPKAWSVVLGGGGLKGGTVIGQTSDDGLTVTDRPVATQDLLATICLGLGLDPKKQNLSNVGRPIRLVDPEAVPVHELL